MDLESRVSLGKSFIYLIWLVGLPSIMAMAINTTVRMRFPGICGLEREISFRVSLTVPSRTERIPRRLPYKQMALERTLLAPNNKDEECQASRWSESERDFVGKEAASYGEADLHSSLRPASLFPKSKKQKEGLSRKQKSTWQRKRLSACR